MRYMLIHAADPDLASQWDDEADASFSAWVEETIRSGVNLQGTRLRPTADATTVKIRSGELVITDGPFADGGPQRGHRPPAAQQYLPGQGRGAGRAGSEGDGKRQPGAGC